MIYRLILAKWLENKSKVPDVLEGDFTLEEVQAYNEQGYNCYYLPNEPSKYQRGTIVEGRQIDVFRFCYVDMDLKEKVHKDKESFIELIKQFELEPSAIVDSGNGLHVYWEVSGLDAMSFLKLQRRLCRKFVTDEAVAKIYQLLRVPETVNVKDPNNYKLCSVLHSSDKSYDVDTLNKALPPITLKDEEYCKAHYDKTYNPDKVKVNVKEDLPKKFHLLVKKNDEVKNLFFGPNSDRSKSDYRLAHLLAAEGFSKDESLSVLYNSSKAIERAPIHRFNYANDIVEKVYSELENIPTQKLSKSIIDILRAQEGAEGDVFPCNKFFDATVHGFRLGEVLGLVGGPSSGKTQISFNMFLGFAQRNPDHLHVFVNLEEQEKDLARRWVKMAGDNKVLHNLIRIITNYNDDGTCRDLSLEEIKKEIKDIEKDSEMKVGCVVVDHIGALKHSSKDAEFEGLIGLCKEMKPFAVSTNTFLIMQSHSNRDKAGPYNDIELNMDAAYGTSQFERWVDYMLTTWQPLSRMYPEYKDNNNLYVQAYKFPKIRVMDPLNDKIKRNDIYALKFIPDTGKLEEMSNEDYAAFVHWDSRAAALRSRDRKQPTRPLKKFTW